MGVHHRGAPNQASPVAVAKYSVHEPATHGLVTHDYAALGLYLDGRGQLEQDGRWEVSAGDVMLIPPGAAHRTVNGSNVHAWGVAVCLPCLLNQGHAGLTEPFERVRNGGAAVISIPSERQEFLQTLIKELQDAVRAPRIGADLDPRQVSLLTLILNEVSTATRSEPIASPPGLVVQSLRFIERHCLGPLSLRDVADAVDRSPAYVTNTLSKATGRSAGSWIRAGRIAEARHRLAHTNDSVEEIGAQVGYLDPTHFIRMFRRECGATPAAWRSRQAELRNADNVRS